MAYIIGLVLILVMTFSLIDNGKNVVTNVLGQIKNKLSATIFPKTEREILIENLNSNNEYLDKFFSESAPTILSSKNVSEKDRQAVKKAVETFSKTKDLIANLTESEKKNNGPIKTIGTIIERIVGKENDSVKKPANISPDSVPTYIPPQCRVECGK